MGVRRNPGYGGYQAQDAGDPGMHEDSQHGAESWDGGGGMDEQWPESYEGYDDQQEDSWHGKESYPPRQSFLHAATMPQEELYE